MPRSESSAPALSHRLFVYHFLVTTAVPCTAAAVAAALLLCTHFVHPQLGLQKQDLIDVIALGAISSPMYALKGPQMAKGNYPTAFPLKHQQKDLRLAIAEANAAAQPLAVIAAANDLYVRARQLGHADADFSAVLEAVKGQEQ